MTNVFDFIYLALWATLIGVGALGTLFGFFFLVATAFKYPEDTKFARTCLKVGIFSLIGTIVIALIPQPFVYALMVAIVVINVWTVVKVYFVLIGKPDSWTVQPLLRLVKRYTGFK